MTEDVRVNGTLVWYYFICKRQVWLMSRQLEPDQENPYIDLGRYLHEQSYRRDTKEINIGNIKIDVMKRGDGQLVVGEVKKSSKFKESARMQLLYYLKQLKDLGIHVKGVLMFPKEKKREEIELTKKDEENIEKVVKDILRIVYLEKPPEVVKIRFCSKCAYKEFCYS